MTKEWDEERIAELRRLAEAVRDRTGVSEDELDAYCRFANLAFPAGVLSLLDALESARRERDDLRETVRIATEETAMLISERDAMERRAQAAEGDLTNEGEA